MMNFPDNAYNGAFGCSFPAQNEQYLFNCVLETWIERPQLAGVYDFEKLKLYHTMLWYPLCNFKSKQQQLQNHLIKHGKLLEFARKCGSDSPLGKLIHGTNDNSDIKQELNDLEEFIRSWEYSGSVYRAIQCIPQHIKYHGLIASWTNSIESVGSLYNMADTVKYTFLIGRTQPDFGFNVNQYRTSIGLPKHKTDNECEIILPMCKKYVSDIFYGTRGEFLKYAINNK